MLFERVRIIGKFMVVMKKSLHLSRYSLSFNDFVTYMLKNILIYDVQYVPNARIFREKWHNPH